VIGAAFYGRMWENVPPDNHGLYQSGKFKQGINYKKLKRTLSNENGFKTYWDDIAKAPYAYNSVEKLFITFDDKRSMELKTKYVMDQRLNGIMFWELTNDSTEDGLLDTIYNTQLRYKRKQ
jgi:chitinase